jgi:hypothetical protein
LLVKNASALGMFSGSYIAHAPDKLRSPIGVIRHFPTLRNLMTARTGVKLRSLF